MLFAGCVTFHVFGTWSLPLIDRDEPRFAEASREMIQRGDYVVPYFNNGFRFDKPPLTYWAQVVSFRLFGENDFAARLPSAIAAALVAVSILAWGCRITDERVGFLAAMIFTLSLQVVEHAKAAVADMWLVFFVTLAHRAGYELLRYRLTNAEHPASNVEPRTRVWWWIFYVALAFAFLAKGPIGWTPLLTVTATIVALREPELFRRFKFGRGLFLTLGLVSLWAIPALVRTHGEFFAIGIGRHVIGRSFSTMEGHGPRSIGNYLVLIPFFFLTVFVSFFPWSLKLPWLIKRVRNKRDKIDIYLLSGILIIFVIFSFVTTKLLHYTLPAFPLLAMLLARQWIAAGRPLDHLKTIGLVFAGACIVLALFVTPFVRPFFPGHDLFTKSRAYLRPEMTFAAVDYEEPSLVWYFRSRVRGFMRTWKKPVADIQPFMEETGPRFVVLPTSLASSLYPKLPENWKSFSTHGFNAVKGKRSDLTLLLKPE